MKQAMKRQLRLRKKPGEVKRSYWDMLDIRVNPEVHTCPPTQCFALPYAFLSRLPPLHQGPLKRSWDLLIVTLVLMLLVMVILNSKPAPPPSLRVARALFFFQFEGPESNLTAPPLTTTDSS